MHRHRFYQNIGLLSSLSIALVVGTAAAFAYYTSVSFDSGTFLNVVLGVGASFGLGLAMVKWMSVKMPVAPTVEPRRLAAKVSYASAWALQMFRRPIDLFIPGAGLAFTGARC